MDKNIESTFRNYVTVSFCKGYTILWESYQICPWDSNKAIIQVDGTPKSVYLKLNAAILKKTRWRLEVNLSTGKTRPWYGVNYGDVIEKKKEE